MNTEKHDWTFITLFILGGLIGVLLGVWALRVIVLAMDAKSPAFWFVSRAAAVVAYLLLWASTVWGILISSKAVKQVVSGPMAFTLHNVTAWVAMGFSAVHAWALLGDRVVNFSLAGILVPFAASYHPVLTGLGTLSLYAGVLVSFSFYLTKRIGHRAWHLIHMLAYLMFVAVTIHGVFMGTDTKTLVMQVIYLTAAGSVLFLTLYRILGAAATEPEPERAPAKRRQRSGSAG